MAEVTRSGDGRRTLPSSWWRLTVVSVGLTLVLTGCGGSSDPASTPTAAPPTATPQPTPSLQMGQVVFAQGIDAEGAAIDPASEIPRSATSIYAVVDVANAQPGSSFTAAWTIDGTAIPELDGQTRLETGVAAGRIAFHLTWQGAVLWPVGALGVTITASSGETVTGVVQIVST